MDGQPSARAHEVIVHIGYDPDTFTEDDLIELRDYTESAAGTEFQIEQSHVDMRLRPFGPLDEYTEPLFIRVIAQHTPDEEAQSKICERLESQISQHFHVPFRLWVEFAPADFTEVTDRKEHK